MYIVLFSSQIQLQNYKLLDLSMHIFFYINTAVGDCIHPEYYICVADMDVCVVSWVQRPVVSVNNIIYL